MFIAPVMENSFFASRLMIVEEKSSLPGLYGAS